MYIIDTMHAYQYITNHYVITQIYVMLLTAQIRYEHHVITLTLAKKRPKFFHRRLKYWP